MRAADIDDRWLIPAWQARSVAALMTTREGGVSRGSYASMNVGDAVGDDPAAVSRNRERLRLALGGAALVYLRQVHGTRVVRVDCAASDRQPLLEADGVLTTEPGVACVVQAADCLPLLFAAPAGTGVAAAHAGWRGLAAGIAEATVGALCDAAGCRPAELDVWLGACIGAERFEVGSDVVDAFGAAVPGAATAECFALRSGEPGTERAKWLADLPRLARLRLESAGVRRISGGGWCTATDASRFFSFRRDGATGRMAAAVRIVQR